MVTESQDTDGMRPAQAAAVIQISVLYSYVFQIFSIFWSHCLFVTLKRHALVS